MTEAEYDRIRALCGKWYQLAEIPGNEHADGLRGCADDLKAVLDSFPEPVPEHHEVGCPSCGATIRARMADTADEVPVGLVEELLFACDAATMDEIGDPDDDAVVPVADIRALVEAAQRRIIHDSCSTCGAEPNEPCRDGCAYAARTHRGWRELPAPTALTERVLEEITEMRRDFPDDI